MREEGNLYKRGDVTVLLAESYGFCWGVERAVQMAYEARKRFPDRKLWITNEIIHNPTVNTRLAEMDVGFVEVVDDEKDFSGIGQGDVVILPAFGASVDEMVLLHDREVEIIDTTCPWVSKVLHCTLSMQGWRSELNDWVNRCGTRLMCTRRRSTHLSFTESTLTRKQLRQCHLLAFI